MLKTRIYSAEHEIDVKLRKFGITRPELIEVAKQVTAARAGAIDVDPLSAAGQFSYIHGTRHLRLLCMPKGWLVDRRENVESIVSPNGVRIVYQNVDKACDLFLSPKAVSGKGPAAFRMISDGQGQLFGSLGLPEAVPPKDIERLNSSVWYFCMSFDGDDVRAELSLPATVEGNNFSVFLERIFIISGGGWGSIPTEKDDSPVEGLPTVARR